MALSADLRMPQFTVERVTTDNCAQDQTSMIGKTKTFFTAFCFDYILGLLALNISVPVRSAVTHLQSNLPYSREH